jgi:hypothetical protein
MTIDRRLKCGVAVILSVVAGAGCGGSNGEKKHAVTGQIVYSGGDLATLTGHNVELALTSNPTIRSYGVIEPDGRFKLETYENGQTQAGAREGTYEARLVIVDEGDGQSKKPKIAARFLKFQMAGWTVQVPPVNDVKLTLTAK